MAAMSYHSTFGMFWVVCTSGSSVTISAGITLTEAPLYITESCLLKTVARKIQVKPFLAVNHAFPCVSIH